MSPMQSYNLDISVREDSQGNGRTFYGAINMAANSGIYIPGIGAYALGEIWNYARGTELWQDKQDRKADRAIRGYAEMGSLNYPCLVSWAGDLDVMFSMGAFSRGWKKFLPESNASKE